MHTLLLTFAAPLMSWGDDSGYQCRETSDHPTKSGTIGLVAAMLGRRRGENMDDLRALRYGCHVDQAGKRLDDLQTMGVRDDGQPAPLQHKKYLMDAKFTIGLETTDLALLENISNAVRFPVFTPYLGRRSCPVAGLITTRLEDGTLEETLTAPGVTYVETPTGQVRNDYPLDHRRFGTRCETMIIRDTDPFELVQEATR